jgi:hypothetical protein
MIYTISRKNRHYLQEGERIFGLSFHPFTLLLILEELQLKRKTTARE